MKRILFGIAVIPVIAMLLINIRSIDSKKEPLVRRVKDNINTIAGAVQPRETMEAIFDKHNLSNAELFKISQSTKKLYNLSKLSVGSVYFFALDEQKRVQSMQYEIDDMTALKITKMQDGFNAEKIKTAHNKKIGALYINIRNNLISSLPSSHKEYLKLAFELSEIYAWDIDFFSDIRNGDSVKIIVEELWAGDVFKGYGNILAAEFLNNGTVKKSYRFEDDGYTDYYDGNGNSLRKTLLKSPLRFKYISSRFSKRRFHPILRIYRPHLGIDYAAPIGTPVSAVGDGTVLYSGYKGQNGKMVRIKHRRGFQTYYGHLSRIHRKIKRGAKVSQGDIIGYVGSTGLSTGPHLDYRIKFNGKFVNPLKVRLPRGKSIPKPLMAKFRRMVDFLDIRFASLTQPVVAYTERVTPLRKRG